MFKRKVKIDNYSKKNGVPLVAIQEKGSVLSEQFNTIRTNLQFANIDSKLQSFMITSSVIFEGKSTVTGNVAVSFAKQGKKVVLVDLDLRRPTLKATFSMNNVKGISNYITDTNVSLEDIVFETTVDNLDVIDSGPIPPNPSELVSSVRIQNLIKQLKGKYDVLIFDVPPILAVTDAQIISTYVDGTILVVREGYTYKDDVKKAINLINNVGGKFVGAILNDVPSNTNAKYGYGYYK